MYVPAARWTGQLFAIALFIAVWIAAVSSWLPSPTAPSQRTSNQGRPEHISTSPPSVAVPVVDNVENPPGDCEKPGLITPILAIASTAANRANFCKKFHGSQLLALQPCEHAEPDPLVLGRRSTAANWDITGRKGNRRDIGPLDVASGHSTSGVPHRLGRW